MARHFRQSYEGFVPFEVDQILEEISTLPIPKLSSQQLYLLDCPITNKEIEAIVFQLAHGPDSISAFFYHEYWSTVKFDIFNTVHAFFHSRSLLKALNHTYITLIPQVLSPSEVHHFRLISLCNVVYKIISKIFVNRLKPFMDPLITPFQNAFIRGRNIYDNILIAHEVFDMLGKMKKRKKLYRAVKIDMSRAYDREN